MDWDSDFHCGVVIANKDAKERLIVQFMGVVTVETSPTYMCSLGPVCIKSWEGFYDLWLRRVGDL